MKKLWKILVICLMLAFFAWFGSVLADRKTLSEDIIRLHVVANSDSEEDQNLKLKVRDTIVEKLEHIMEKLPSKKEARAYILDHIRELKAAADSVLKELGSLDSTTVTLTEECFDTRQYETFSLPAGVYESLRVTIGDGDGKNWWCVVFPTLCAGATVEEFADTAAGSGFDAPLTGALEGERTYEIRFFVLDWLGRLQNLFHRN